MPNLASITLIGHLGRDPEQRHTSTGKTVTSATLAVSTGYGERKVTTWYRLTVWGKPADWLSRDCRKGDAICVTGEPSMREYESNGEKRQSLEVNVNSFVSLAPRREKAEEESHPDDGFPF